MSDGAENAIRGELDRAGYLVFADSFDPGILRVTVARRFVGIVIIRDGRVTYAEHAGRIFPFHRPGGFTIPHNAIEFVNLLRFIRKNPST